MIYQTLPNDTPAAQPAAQSGGAQEAAQVAQAVAQSVAQSVAQQVAQTGAGDEGKAQLRLLDSRLLNAVARAAALEAGASPERADYVVRLAALSDLKLLNYDLAWASENHAAVVVHWQEIVVNN